MPFVIKFKKTYRGANWICGRNKRARKFADNQSAVNYAEAMKKMGLIKSYEVVEVEPDFQPRLKVTDPGHGRVPTRPVVPVAPTQQNLKPRYQLIDFGYNPGHKYAIRRMALGRAIRKFGLQKVMAEVKAMNEELERKKGCDPFHRLATRADYAWLSTLTKSYYRRNSHRGGGNS